jgi:hypothetical protein
MPRTRLVALGGLLAALSSVLAAQQQSLEYDVKAAFVLNFVRYVEWPPTHTTPPLRLCVLYADPVGNRLHGMVGDEQWQGGAIDVRVVPDMRSAAACHLLYVPQTAAARFSTGISAISGLPVLTVGEHERFLEQGGMIRLFLEDNKIRFSINLKSADGAGLVISSRLLRLARSVTGASEGR